MEMTDSKSYKVVYYIIHRNAVSPSLLELFFKEIKNVEFKQASVQNDLVDKKVRNVESISVNRSYWLSSIVTDSALKINKQVFKFDISDSFQVDLLRYPLGGEYIPHIDTFLDFENNISARKLTAICLLNNNFSGGDLSIFIDNEPYKIDLSVGDIIVFPSFLTHVVSPVTSGVRYSLVTWLEGPQFK